MTFSPLTLWEWAKAGLEIAILWIVYYRLLVFFEGTRALQVIIGITYLMVALLCSKLLGFEVLNWLLRNFFSIWIVMIVVVFQHELRAGLARLGQQHLFNISLGTAHISNLLEEIADAVFKLSKHKTGCLIAIERKIKLNLYIESGVEMDSKLSSPLLQSIFMTSSPLHDGGVVIRGERIAACSCLFPLSENPSVGKTVGTRHRAALGLSEQADAVILVVSEQTGDVSIALDGRFIGARTQAELLNTLKELFIPAKRKRGLSRKNEKLA